MGTNFYARHIPTELEYAKMQEALTNRELNRLRELLDASQKEYHIGKRSGGWQFLFAPHMYMRDDWRKGEIVSPWENTLESIKEYLSRPDVEIYNEYGDKFTPEQFWNEEIGHCLYNDPEHYINGAQYDKREEEEDTWDSWNKGPLVETFEFTTEEGLRFAKDADFC